MPVIDNLVKAREQVTRLCGGTGILLFWRKRLDGVEAERGASSSNVLDKIETDFPLEDAGFLRGTEPGEGQEGDEEGGRVEVVTNEEISVSKKREEGKKMR